MSTRLQNLMPCGDLPSGSAEASSPLPRNLGRGQLQALTGNDAVALAVKQVDPHVVAAYPIAPQSELVHKLAEYRARGESRVELVNVESEHSAMSAALAASAAGCRVFTASSSLGLAHMMEVYYNTGALRLPVVMSLVNRHLGGLLNIHNDHGDAMLARNAPWIQLHGENSQEAYDNAVQAFRIAEDERVRLPVTVCHDGFVVSHTLERLLVLPDEQVQQFVGECVPPVDLLDTEHPRAVGPLVMPDYAAHLYAQIADAMRRATAVIEEVGQEYGLLTGRSYGLFEPYRLDDAEVAVLAMGSVCGTVRAVVDLLRSHGVRAGMLKLRAFRPMPGEALAATLAVSGVKALAVLDKACELGSGGPLFIEVSAALALHAQVSRTPPPLLTDVILGIGGRDVTFAQINAVFRRLLEMVAGGPGGDPVWFMDVDGRGERRIHGGMDAKLPTTRDIVLVARGGHGATLSAHLLAQLAIESGKFAQSLPTFGPERTGAPIKAFAKIGDQPIDERQQIYAPDVLVVFDELLLETCERDVQQLRPDGVLVVNTKLSPAEIRERLQLIGRQVYTVDATGIALDELGAHRPNTAMLGALVRILGFGQLVQLKDAFRGKMKRLSEHAVQNNERAMHRGAAELNAESADAVGIETG